MRRIMLKWNLRNISEVVDWILLAESTVQWRDLVKTVMNIRVPRKEGNFVAS